MRYAELSADQARIVESNYSLSRYLSSLANGREATPHSWLYEKEETATTVNRWVKQLTGIMNAVAFGSEFLTFDLDKLKRLGPQGAIPPFDSEEVQNVLEPIFAASPADDELALQQFFPEAVAFAKFVFGSGFHSRKPKLFKDVIADMDKRDTLITNSGIPNFRRRVLDIQDAIADARSGKAYEYPAIVLFRYYRGKLRPVWMYPMSMNLIEAQFSQVIQEYLRESSPLRVRQWLSPWVGFDQVKRTITEQYKDTSWIVGGDTSKMDAHMRPAQIRLVFEIVKHLFAERFWEPLYKAMMQVNTIELLTGRNSKLVGIHGLASGSNWTQLVETILIMFIAWRRNIVSGQGIGDDFILKEKMSADDLVKMLLEFMLPANADKQCVEEFATEFLQRRIRKGFFSREDEKVLGAYYSTVWALISMLQPERFHSPKQWNSDMFCLRIYTILENTVDTHAFPQFVKYVVNGQRDLIPFAKKSASELVEIQNRGRRLVGLTSTYNQEKRGRPLSDFASIKIAATL